MAEVKISALPAAAALTGAETVPVVQSAATVRTTLSLISTLFGASSQPLDSDLTAIAALTTTSYGRAFLALVDAAAGRTALGLGTAATSATTAFDAAGSSAAAQAASQPLDSDLTAIAALTTTSFGRSLLALADGPAVCTTIGAVKGTTKITVAATAPASPATNDLWVDTT